MRGRGGSWLQVAIVLVILVAVNLLAQRFFLRVDLTENREYTLNAATKRVLSRLDDVINVTVYFSKELPSYFATLDRQVKDLLDEYAAHSGDRLQVQFVDPGDDPALEQSLRMMGIPKLQLSTYQGERAEVMNAYLGVAVQYGGKNEAIPVVQNVARLEYDITSAILKVSGERRTVGLALGAGPSLPEEWAPVREALSEQYAVREVDLEAGDVPLEVTTLVTVDREDLSESALYRIDQFVMRGGRLFVMTGGVDVTLGMLQARDREVTMGPLLRAYGVEVQNALVADAQAPLVGFDIGFFLPLSIVYPWFPQMTEKGLSRTNPVTSEMQSLVLPFVSPLVPVPVDSSAGASIAVEVLARSSERSFARTAPYDLNPQNRVTPPAGSLAPQDLVLALSGRFPSAWAGRPAPADTLGLAPPPAAVSSETQIVVAGSQHFLTAQFLRQYPANAVFLANAVDWMTMGTDLIAIRSRTGAARPLKEVPDERRGLYKTLAMLPVPVLVVVFGFLRAHFRRARFRRHEVEFGGRRS
jgi:gliding-associated putative ABC transporter substrate-binding component GldG